MFDDILGPAKPYVDKKSRVDYRESIEEECTETQSPSIPTTRSSHSTQVTWSTGLDSRRVWNTGNKKGWTVPKKFSGTIGGGRT